MTTQATRFTYLTILLCSVVLFACALFTPGTTEGGYIVRCYLACVGIAFMVIGMLIEALGLMIERD